MLKDASIILCIRFNISPNFLKVRLRLKIQFTEVCNNLLHIYLHEQLPSIKTVLLIIINQSNKPILYS